MRAFASRTDRDLWIGISIATVVIFFILMLVGSTGLLAAFSGAWPGNPPQDGSIAFFLLLPQLPAWVVGVSIVMVVSLSTSAFDSLQSAMASTASNDLFRNRLNIWWIRAAVVLINIPVVVLALKSPSVLQIYLISDLISASTIPVLFIGLADRFYYWRGFEVIVGGLGGILTVFIFGTIYYGNAKAGANLILLEGGLYANDWGAFGAFVAAPVGGLLWALGAFLLRVAYEKVKSKRNHERFAAFDRPPPADRSSTAGGIFRDEDRGSDVVVSDASPEYKT
jgi:Na+/proline symporter